MLEAEDENYNLFKLINELNKEVGVWLINQPFSLLIYSYFSKY